MRSDDFFVALFMDYNLKLMSYGLQLDSNNILFPVFFLNMGARVAGSGRKIVGAIRGGEKFIDAPTKSYIMWSPYNFPNHLGTVKWKFETPSNFRFQQGIDVYLQMWHRFPQKVAPKVLFEVGGLLILFPVGGWRAPKGACHWGPIQLFSYQLSKPHMLEFRIPRVCYIPRGNYSPGKLTT